MMMLQSVAALAAVLALFAALVWGLRKMQFRHLPEHESAMRVVQRLSIDSRHSLVEVEHGDKRYLLGLSPSGMAAISECEQALQIDVGKPDTGKPDADNEPSESKDD